MSDHGCSYKNGLQVLHLNLSLHSRMRSMTSEQLRRKYGVAVDHIRYVVVDADGGFTSANYFEISVFRMAIFLIRR